MSPTTLLVLARPATAVDRDRFRLVAGSTAIAGGLLLAAARIIRLPADSTGPGAPGDGGVPPGLAPYVAESGLRPGVVLGAVLLAVLLLGIAVQVLRVGSPARERRLASLRLAGATPGEVRVVAAAESGAAAGLGGLLAGSVYALLWLLLGALPPSGARLLPEPSVLDLPWWAGLVLLAGLAGGLAGAAVHRRVTVAPLAVHRRGASQQPGRANLGLLLVGGLLVAGGLLLPLAAPRGGMGTVVAASVALLLGLLLTALAAAPRLVRRQGRRLAGSSSPVRLLAGARLAAEPRPPGRAAAVLLICGFALGVQAVTVAWLLAERLRPADSSAGVVVGGEVGLGFYLAGFGLAAATTLAAALVASLSLFVGAVDQLLDARRSLASLAALGVEEHVLLAVLHREQAAVSVPAVVLGAGVGGALASLPYASVVPGLLLPALLSVLVAAVAAGLAVAALARLATRLLRSRLLAALHPDNLRTA